MENLTARELEVLRLIAAGKSTKQIAAELGIAFKTIAAHRSSIMSKLAAINSAHLITVAVACGLLHVRDNHQQITESDGDPQSKGAMGNHIPAQLAKTRHQIEAELHAALESTRQEYEKYRWGTSKQLDVADATLGTPDGMLALRQANQHLKAGRRALQQYRKALQRFNDFFLHGKLPPDADHR